MFVGVFFKIIQSVFTLGDIRIYFTKTE